jgi:hypothetical protein
MMNISKISLVLTLIAHISVLLTFKLLDDFNLIITIFSISLICGFLLKLYAKNSLKKVGWGLFYGVITSLILVGGFMIWLEINYPK